MECPKCHHDNRADAAFCSECAAPLPRACPQCGRANPAGSKFCDGCAFDLTAGADGRPAEISTVSEGERRQATVLFSDLSGFTTMSEKLDPEEVLGLMRRLKDRAVEIVEAHGGIVSQFVGDEVLALFGIPTSHEDDPVRAVRAALELHELARKLSPDVEEKIGRPLRMHTGIDSGLVVTSTADIRDGTIGVTGDTVNTGARLKALATDDAILLSPETQRLVADFFDTEPLESAKLKGKAETVAPYRVTGETAVRSRFQAAEARGFTPFTGREEERATLQRCLEKAIAGDGQFVTVMGEVGVGKSRLLYEFRHSIDRNKVAVVEGRCQIHGQETPYLPLIDALRRGLQLREEDSAADLADKAVANILAIDPALERYVPHYLHLLSIPSQAHPMPPELQGEALRRELEEALAASTTLNTEHKPMVLIYEDWQWADEASDAALKHLTNLVGHYPLLLIILYRPEYTRAWGEMEHYTAIVLKSLDFANTEVMVRAVLGAEQLPEGLAARIHERTGGNALFNEEVARSFMEEGAVVVREGTAELAGSVEELRLPDTVHAVIRSRIDRLDPAAREVLRLASVIGREFGRNVLERLYLARERLAAGLETLARQDLVHQVRVVPEPAYIFKHVLTQVVVYETLLLQQRKELNAKVGEVIEDIYADRLEEHYESLAFHYGNSENVEKAIDYMGRSARKAARRSSLSASVHRYRDVINLLDSIQMTDDQKRQRIDFSLALGHVATSYPSKRNFSILENSIVLAEDIGDTKRVARAELILGVMSWVSGDPRPAITRLQSSMEKANRIGDEITVALAEGHLGQSYCFLAEFSEAVHYLSSAISALEPINYYPSLQNFQTYRAYVFGWIGDFRFALAEFPAIFETARSRNNSLMEQAAFMFMGCVQFYQGDWGASIDALAHAIELERFTGDKFLSAAAISMTGAAHAMKGNHRKGVQLLTEGLEMLKKTGSTVASTWYHGTLAEIYALSGAVDRSLVNFEAAMDIVKLRSERVGEVVAVRANALAITTKSPPDWQYVDSRINDCLRLARARGQRPELAITHFRYAECLHKKGDLDAARAQLGHAEALFRDMGMVWWPDQAEGLRGRIDRGEEFVWFAPYVDGPPG